MGKSEAAEKARNVRFVILDIHGVLTDNTLYYTQDGIKSELFSLHDRLGVKALVDSGIGVSFLTSKISRADEQMGKIYGIPPENLWGSSAKIGKTRRIREGFRAEGRQHMLRRRRDDRSRHHEEGLLFRGPCGRL